MWPALLTMDWVGSLGWAFCTFAVSWLLYATYLFVYTILKHERPKHAKIWMRWVAAWMKLKDKGWANSLALPYLFALVCCVLLFVAAYRSRANIVTEHNVAIYKQLDNGDWLMSSTEDDSLVFRPCREDSDKGIDVNSLLQSGIGYIADYAKWEERGTCKSILRADLGFWFRDRNNNFTYKRIK